MIKQAMERGFLKAALDTGLDPLSAITIMKQANPMLEYLQSQMHGLGDQIYQHPELAGGVIGGLGGAGIGALSSDEHRGRNALIGGLGGAGLGAGLGYLGHQHGMFGEGNAVAEPAGIQDPQPAPPMSAGPEIPGVTHGKAPHNPHNRARMLKELDDLRNQPQPGITNQLPGAVGESATDMVDNAGGAMDTASDYWSQFAPGGNVPPNPGADQADRIMKQLNGGPRTPAK